MSCALQLLCSAARDVACLIQDFLEPCMGAVSCSHGHCLQEALTCMFAAPSVCKPHSLLHSLSGCTPCTTAPTTRMHLEASCRTSSKVGGLGSWLVGWLVRRLVVCQSTGRVWRLLAEPVRRLAECLKSVVCWLDPVAGWPGPVTRTTRTLQRFRPYTPP